MPPIKAHFDGRSIVLDEPAVLSVGQAVRVIVESSAESAPLGGFTRGTFETAFSPHADATAALMAGEPMDERDAMHIDPLDRVPPDFVRKPGSGAGEIRMAADFDATPAEFEGHL